MEQDIAVRTMMLMVKYDDQIPPEYQGFVRKYLSLMHVVGFDYGCEYITAKYGTNKKTACVQYDNLYNRIAQYNSVKEASIATDIPQDNIFKALKDHKLTKRGYYWTKVS